MTKHTPGPWEHRAIGWMPHEIDELEHSYRSICANGAVGCFEVCRVWEDECDYEMQTNSRLIAAAPEMFAALKAAVDALNRARRFKVGDTDSYKIAAQCDRAIAKAEGRDA